MMGMAWLPSPYLRSLVPTGGNSGAMAAPERVVVVDYDPNWPTRAAELIEELTNALGPTARRVDHIGSTSIPDMAAKDVLDIQVSVDDLELAATAFDEPLRSLGFEPGPYGHDHVPAGSADDPELWRKRYWSRRGSAAPDVNLHVRTVGSPNERLALLFPDWFRTHPSAIPAYAAFKRALADAVPDSGVYSEVKDPVVDLVITIAETWAKHTSWTPSR
jgi:GrpB-like predicted nucleotidyltransferase (UPF0157 family)